MVSVDAASVPPMSEPCAAYVHVPFCRHHCGYCNFTVVAGRDDLTDQFLVAIERELAGLERPRTVDTLFVGGGTPTHLPPAAIERFLTTVRRWFPLAPGMNSASKRIRPISRLMLRLLAAHGVTRLSLGAQSFAAEKLRVLERDHEQYATERVDVHNEKIAVAYKVRRASCGSGAPVSRLQLQRHEDESAASRRDPDKCWAPGRSTGSARGRTIVVTMSSRYRALKPISIGVLELVLDLLAGRAGIRIVNRERRPRRSPAASPPGRVRTRAYTRSDRLWKSFNSPTACRRRSGSRAQETGKVPSINFVVRTTSPN